MFEVPNLPFATKRETYSPSDGPINYLNGEGLERPLTTPRSQMIIMGAFVAAAIVIAIAIMVNFSACSQSNITAQTPENQIAQRQVDLSLPSLTEAIAFTSGDALKEQYTLSGYQMYDVTSDADAAANAMDIIRIPSDITLAQAQPLLSRGIANLNSNQATTVLYGSWRLKAIFAEANSITLSYADFKSASPQEALAALYAAEGFTAEGNEIQESPTDETGTAVSSGTVNTATGTFHWEATVVPLTTHYEINGLPQNAQFVTVTFQ